MKEQDLFEILETEFMGYCKEIIAAEKDLKIERMLREKCNDSYSNLIEDNKRLRSILSKWKEACDGKAVILSTNGNGQWLMDLMWENTKALKGK